MKKNCMDIQNLEERLLCLQEKLQELTSALQHEREYIMTSDETGSTLHLTNEVSFVKRQIESTKKRIKTAEKIASRKKSDNINVGSRIKLENTTHCLDFYLVDESSSRPDSGMISVSTPLGKAVLGKRKGQTYA